MPVIALAFFALLLGFSSGCGVNSTYVENTADGYFIAVQPQFADVRDFHEGLAAAAVSRGRRGNRHYLWGFINTSGEWVVEPQFYFPARFSDGAAIVQFTPNETIDGVLRTGQNGVIDKTGNIIVEPGRYDMLVSPFHNGLAAAFVFTDDDVFAGKIDTNGTEVIPLVYRFVI